MGVTETASTEVDEKEKWLRVVSKPLCVIHENWLHLLWIIGVTVISSLNIISSWITGNQTYHNFFSIGTFYSYSLVLLAPDLMNFLIILGVNAKIGKKSNYLQYRVPIAIIEFLFILVIPYLYEGRFKPSIPLQSIFVILTLMLIFFMYCVSQMELYSRFQKYDDVSYIDKEEKSINETKQKLHKLGKKKTTEEGYSL